MERAVTEAEEGLEGLFVAAFGQQPTRRLRTHVHLSHDEQCGDTGLHGSVSRCVNMAVKCTHTSKHETPVETSNARGVLDRVEGNVHDVAEHDAKGSPQLPHHDERATNDRRRTLRGIHRDRRGLGANTESEEETCDEEVPPCVGDSLPDTSREREECTDEDGTATAETLVERGGDPATDQATAQLDRRSTRARQTVRRM